MRILITNDDGIGAPALPQFVRWAKTLGEVTVIAPKYGQSGKSQAIDFYQDIEIKKLDFEGCEAYSVDSTPADCVRFATIGLHRQYDLVLSGINSGYNLGHDIVYSGTVGAAFEAARRGIKAIAFSTEEHIFSFAFDQIDDIYEYIKSHNLLDHASVLNVNIPPQKCLGIRMTKQGELFYVDRFVHKGNDIYVQEGEPVYKASDDLSFDVNAVRNGYISISPLTEERTDFAAYEILKNI